VFKIIIIAVLLTLGYLFFPRHELYGTEGSFSDHYISAEKTFWSKEDCHATGKSLKGSYRCMTMTPWRKMMNRQSEYNKERIVE